MTQMELIPNGNGAVSNTKRKYMLKKKSPSIIQKRTKSAKNWF